MSTELPPMFAVTPKVVIPGTNGPGSKVSMMSVFEMNGLSAGCRYAATLTKPVEPPASAAPDRSVKVVSPTEYVPMLTRVVFMIRFFICASPFIQFTSAIYSQASLAGRSC